MYAQPEYVFDTKDNADLLTKKDTCDKYDYLAAVACGAIGGIIDIFLVGTPGDSALGNWTDEQVDNAVMSFAKKMGWNPRAKNKGNVNSAIGFLEGKYRVNYDQRKPSDVGDLFNIAPKTHHMMSPAHSPDVVGLFFSVLNQFTSTSSFVAKGQLITVQSHTYELQGGNFIAKLFCGIANWIGHLMSDVAGSSGAHGRGMGIVIPFYEFFGVCKLGAFKTGDGGMKDLSEIAMQAFTEGYDFRFGVAMAIPVAVTNLSISLIWALRRHFQYGYPVKECIPTSKHETLRVMLLMGNGTLCVMDAIDAGLRSGMEPIGFFMHLNLIAWFRLVTLVLKEICIRVGLKDALAEDLEALKRINAALGTELERLKSLDIERYKKETARYNELSKEILCITKEEDLHTTLVEYYKNNDFSLPWKGDFDTFMSDRNSTMVFE